MADEKRRNGQKITAKSKGKSKSRWKKPANLLNIGNKEKGKRFNLLFWYVRERIIFTLSRIKECVSCKSEVLYVIVGHAFAEKRKKIALKEYKKLLRKTREEHRKRQSSENKDKPLLPRPTRVSDVTTSADKVCFDSHSIVEFKDKETKHTKLSD